MKKVVIFVDVQNDFVKGGVLSFAYPEEDNVPKIVEFAKSCITEGCKLYATRDTHKKTEYKEEISTIDNNTAKKIPVSGYMTTLEGQKLPVEHCVEMTNGWMIEDRLMQVFDGHVTIVDKPTFGSYDLVKLIEEDLCEPDEIVLCGYCTSICVAANAILLRAKFPNTKICIKEDCCGCVSHESHNATIATLKMQQIDII